MGCINYCLLWYIHVHIGTEVLSTLHPGATGLCFIVKGLVGDSDSCWVKHVGKLTSRPTF